MGSNRVLRRHGVRCPQDVVANGRPIRRSARAQGGLVVRLAHTCQPFRIVLELLIHL
jgi:hypothetical protein